jgi:predicted SAM-dependent methyltransferase
MKALNLGCGSRSHPDWENLDLFPVAPTVRAHDLRKGIPFSDGTFDVVYHSHVLEHFSKQAAPGFLRECHRVLKSGGIIRVAVPDLERIARLYLEALERASHGMPGWRENYEWMVLEMFDQTVRETSGGSCREYLRQDPIPNWSFICERWGTEAKAVVEAVRAETLPHPNGHSRSRAKGGAYLRHFGRIALNKIAKTLLSEQNYEALRVGRFRRQGEIHQWMYDTYSLAQLLQRAGFCNCRRCTATESQISNWAGYQLDAQPAGTPHKPDSLFMEAAKP